MSATDALMSSIITVTGSTTELAAQISTTLSAAL
jgi:hypothetical protein